MKCKSCENHTPCKHIEYCEYCQPIVKNVVFGGEMTEQEIDTIAEEYAYKIWCIETILDLEEEEINAAKDCAKDFKSGYQAAMDAAAKIIEAKDREISRKHEEWLTANNERLRLKKEVDLLESTLMPIFLSCSQIIHIGSIALDVQEKIKEIRGEK